MGICFSKSDTSTLETSPMTYGRNGNEPMETGETKITLEKDPKKDQAEAEVLE